MYFLQYHNLISCSQSSFPAFSRINQTPNKSWSELYYAGKPLFQKNVLFYLSFLSWDTEHSFCMIPSPTLHLFIATPSFFIILTVVPILLISWTTFSSSKCLGMKVTLFPFHNYSTRLKVPWCVKYVFLIHLV